jgi:hypothetical protein
MGMFKTAKVVETKKPAKAGKAEVQVSGLKTLAEIDALIKALDTLKSTLSTEVKDFAFDHFYTTANGVRPTSFRGIDGDASASIEMRKKSTMSVLGEAEQQLLTEAGVPFEKMVGTVKMFGINPTYTTNDDLLAKVEAALTGIVPEDFIVVQEEKSKYVVTDATVEQAFAKNASREVIAAITVLAIKPKLAVTDIATIMDDVKAMIAATPVVAKSDEAAA